jgi:hypothetical protein
MIDIVDKTNGQNVEDYQYNSVKNNSLDIVESSGQTPVTDTGVADTNTQQISIGMAIYAAGGQFYIDSGVANAYVLGVQTISGTPMRAPNAYFNGMTARFTAINTNTGISTVNVATLGIKTIKKGNWTTDLDAGDIVAGFTYDLVYNTATGFFELKPLRSTNDIGIIGIAGDVAVNDGTNWIGSPQDTLYPTASIVDQKANTVDGGTFTSGAWRTRDLNTELWDDIGITVSSNEITLPAGIYIIHAIAPAFDVNSHKARLYNVTDASVIVVGTHMKADDANEGYNNSTLMAKLIIASPKNIRLEHICQVSQATNGFGVGTNIGGDSEVEHYSQVFIQKLTQ